MISSVRIEQEVLIGGSGRGSLFMQVVLVLGGVVVYGLSAQFSVMLPFTPVPVTGQTFALFLLSGILGQRMAVLSAVSYLLAGFAGLPVFAGGLGGFIPTAMSFGYLPGLVLGAWVMGHGARRGWLGSMPGLLLNLLLANLAIYVPGILWMGILAGFDKPLLAWGLFPFLVGDALKMGLAFGTLAGFRKVFYRG